MKQLLLFILLLQTVSSFSQQKQISYQELQDSLRRVDWGYLNRYAEENAALGKALAGEHRIVFMGNSITEGWKKFDSSFFIGRSYIDRGISGQTTPQMLLRFRPDVINLNASVVVILGGINDIAGNTGPMTAEQTFGNIVSMAELGRANHIKVVLCSILPAFDFPWHPGMEPAEKVIKLNEMIKSYAKSNHLVYVDYFAAMVDARKGLKSEYTYDGIHPNLAGYRVMEPLVEKGIAASLSRLK